MNLKKTHFTALVSCILIFILAALLNFMNSNLSYFMMDMGLDLMITASLILLSSYLLKAVKNTRLQLSLAIFIGSIAGIIIVNIIPTSLPYYKELTTSVNSASAITAVVSYFIK